ncbi:hypothetical protein L0F63_002447 [Massospora cicadina]|nr:hypothetical protein L0F63_002447 [Massospora cicadina]
MGPKAQVDPLSQLSDLAHMVDERWATSDLDQLPPPLRTDLRGSDCIDNQIKSLD